MPEVSQILAEFVADSRWEHLPPPVRHEAKRGILNFAGCMLAGRNEPEIRLLREVYPHDDAIVDAAASTAFDYDDTHLRTVTHATPPVGAAVFALSRQMNVSGREFMHAFALGLETTCRLANVVMPGHYEHGWHITSTCGIFGATVAAAKILKLNEKQIVSSLGFAATQSAGLVEMLGSMGRILNAGVAARNGIDSARLAAKGFTGPARPLEGQRGFLNVFGGNNDLRYLTEGLGRDWEMRTLAYKPYPTGVVIHALIDACLDMQKQRKMPEKITVRLHPLAVERTNRPEPRNALEARLSAQQAVAVALLRGRAGNAEFSDAAAVDPQIVAFRKRVSVVPEPGIDKMAAIIEADGATIRVDAARPMDDARLEAKFREQAGAHAGTWLRFVETLESQDPVKLPG